VIGSRISVHILTLSVFYTMTNSAVTRIRKVIKATSILPQKRGSVSDRIGL
jgi:hypothetical protein